MDGRNGSIPHFNEGNQFLIFIQTANLNNKKQGKKRPFIPK